MKRIEALKWFLPVLLAGFVHSAEAKTYTFRKGEIKQVFPIRVGETVRIYYYAPDRRYDLPGFYEVIENWEGKCGEPFISLDIYYAPTRQGPWLWYDGTRSSKHVFSCAIAPGIYKLEITCYCNPLSGFAKGESGAKVIMSASSDLEYFRDREFSGKTRISQKVGSKAYAGAFRKAYKNLARIFPIENSFHSNGENGSSGDSESAKIGSTGIRPSSKIHPLLAFGEVKGFYRAEADAKSVQAFVYSYSPQSSELVKLVREFGRYIKTLPLEAYERAARSSGRLPPTKQCAEVAQYYQKVGEILGERITSIRASVDAVEIASLLAKPVQELVQSAQILARSSAETDPELAKAAEGLIGPLKALVVPPKAGTELEEIADDLLEAVERLSKVAIEGGSTLSQPTEQIAKTIKNLAILAKLVAQSGLERTRPRLEQLLLSNISIMSHNFLTKK